MAKNANLHKAKKEKNDEFYTQSEDINNEMENYDRNYFKDKVVYCNCDDPKMSNFTKYFVQMFDELKLKKLICTHYVKEGTSYKLELISNECNGHQYKLNEMIETPLKGNGDFRSEECVELLKEADIVVTNPPFSLFREYVAQLMEYKKKFIIIGNKNAIAYKEIFPLIKENKIWIGSSSPDSFMTPKGEITEQIKGLCRWFTNMDLPKRHENILLYKKYNEKDYPKYDNYNAIEVSKVENIPVDYYDVMGVPITFLDKYNPEQFEIIGYCASHGKTPKNIPNEAPYMNGKWLYNRILIKRKQ